MTLEPILALVRSQEELRFFVDGTRNLGHQAATVNLMKQLISMAGFAGRAILVYADPVKVEHGDTAHKLAYLLVGLDPTIIERATVGYGTCRSIRFLRYADRERLVDEQFFGFTGGADDMSINFARELKVRYFLRLQPYLWDDDASRKADPYYESSRIEEPDDRYCFLADEYPGFRQLSYRFPHSGIRSVGDEVWRWYCQEQTFDAALKACAANASAVYQAHQGKPSLLLWPLYGLQHFRELAADIALNLALVALQAQRVLREPVIAIIISDSMQVPGTQDLVRPFARDLVARDSSFPYLKAALAARLEAVADCPLPWGRLDALIAAIAARVAPWLAAGERLTILSDHDPTSGTHTDISDTLRAVLGCAGNSDVVLVFTGYMPVDAYNYLYANCSIPGVFEGQASSSLVVSLGRPFLQIPREGHVIENSYPSKLAGRDFSTMALTLNHLARQLRDQCCTRYLLGEDAGDPGPLLEQLGQVAEFIVEAQNPSSGARAYFEAMREHFQQDAHDKLSVGLAALQTRAGYS